MTPEELSRIVEMIKKDNADFHDILHHLSDVKDRLEKVEKLINDIVLRRGERGEAYEI